MFLLYDIGGTKIRLGVSRDLQKIDKVEKASTSEDFEKSMEDFSELVEKLTGGEKIEASAGGISGTWNQERTKLLNSPNASGWVEKPIKEEIEKITGAPTHIENDAAMVGLGESVFGAGKNYSIMVYITVSTGVGGARIVDSKIDRSAFGFEPGHQILKIPENSSLKDVLTLEGLASGTAVQKKFGVPPYKVEDPQVWEELALWLAFGVFNSILHWSPKAVVLGGPMIVGNPAISVERVKYYLQKINQTYPELPDIKQAILEDNGGLYGAMAFLRSLKTS